MLQSQYRLRKDADFQSMYRRSKRKYNRLFTLYVRKGRRRVGIVVSKKHGKAVVRNLLKRRIRAVLEEELPKLGAYDCVIVPKVGAADLPFAELRRNLLHVLKIGELYA